MAGGGFVAQNGFEPKKYHGVVTFYVAFATAVAASGGLIFGYDIGITGKRFLESLPSGTSQSLQSCRGLLFCCFFVRHR